MQVEGARGGEVITDPWKERLQAGARVLEAGLWLISNGLGRMQILPYIAPSGCYWRCEFHPTGRSNRPLYRYSSSSEFRYLENHCGGSVRKNIGTQALANAIIKSVPDEVRERCMGPCSFETLVWQLKLMDYLERKLLPSAFHEYTEDFSTWSLFGASGTIDETIEPLPGYIPPGKEPPDVSAASA